MARVAEASRELLPVIAVGGPLRAQHGVFNVAVVIHRGRVLGVVPKSYLPNYREFYEERQFRAGARVRRRRGRARWRRRCRSGPDLVFDAADLPGLALHFEICEDVWVPLPPSTYGAMAGATVLANLSASNITVGKADFRRTLCMAQSARTIAAYIYSAAGLGRVDDRSRVGRAGADLRERRPGRRGRALRRGGAAPARRSRSRPDGLRPREHEQLRGLDPRPPRARSRASGTSPFELGVGTADAGCTATIERFPYVPADPKSRNERCDEVYNIQVHGLETRLRATGIKKVVIGVSGGLDSTHALIVVRARWTGSACRARTSSPTRCPASRTSDRTKGNAWKLMQALGVTAREIDIRPSAEQMLRDLEHPFVEGEPAVRHHLRERPGRRAHLAPVPARQPPRRARHRHRRPVRARARLVRPTASATTCRTTASTPPCPRR